MRRTLFFTLNISTELDEGDEVEPTIEYVEQWLTEQRYDSHLASSHTEPVPEPAPLGPE